MVCQPTCTAQTPPAEPQPARSLGRTHLYQRRRQGTAAERRRLTLAFLLSLLFHGLILSLTFGDQEFGLPGLDFPWRQRRIEAPDLRVVLVPVQTSAARPIAMSVEEPSRQVSDEQAVASEPASTPPAFSVSIRATEVILPKIGATARTKPKQGLAIDRPAAKVSARTEGSGDAEPAPAVIALDQPDKTTWIVRRPPPAPTPGIEDEPSASGAETAMPAPEGTDEMLQKQAEPDVPEQAVEAAKFDPPAHAAQRQADQLEAARIEAERKETARIEAERNEAVLLAAAKLEAQRQEAARREAARIEAERLEAQRQETVRREAARVEAARLEAERREAERLAAVKLEAQRREAARIEAARLEAERKEAERLEAARLETQRQEAARIEAARLETQRKEDARVQAEQDEDARRDARCRAMGRQLEEEAARRAAAANAALPPAALRSAWNIARRVRLWGRADPNAELVQYAETWARKIQLNTPVDTIRDLARRPHTKPLVTVAIRGDGSVESVTFVLSSGSPEVDEAIRRIVHSHLPYPAFPPGLARDYDVVEIRRTWHFDTTIQLY